jgi:hypothetical protein
MSRRDAQLDAHHAQKRHKMSSIRAQFENTKIAKLAPAKRVTLINKYADNADLSPNQLIDAKREEIAEFIESKPKKMTPAQLKKLAHMELQLFTLRRCYHTMLDLRKAKKVARRK